MPTKETKSNIKKVLVLGFHTPVFLSVIRSLGRANIQVHVAWYKEDRLALCSKYVFQAHALPPYQVDSTDWKSALIELLIQENFDLVIPCHDEMVVPLQRHRVELEKYAHLYTISDECFDVLFDKAKTTELARKAGVSVPREIVLNGEDQKSALEKLSLNGFDFPLVLKPHTSYCETGSLSRILVKTAYNQEDFIHHLAALLPYGPVIVQEYFYGKGVGVNFLLHEGQPLLVFQQERVHEPLRGGTGTYRKSTAVSPELQAASLKILSPLKYTGVAMAEFRVNPKSGEWVLLEINARFWGSLPLAIACGANFPLALFQLLTEGKVTVNPTYRIGIYSRNLTSDIAWQLKNLKANQHDPTLLALPVRQVFREGLVNTLTFKERIDTLAWDDVKPFWGELAGIGHIAIEKLAKTVYTDYLAFPPILALQKKSLHNKIKSTKSVLFICRGNVCRSPFAEYFLKAQPTPLVSIESAGFFQEQGRIPPQEALTVALEFGIDLSKHWSKIINEEVISSADLIFVFDDDNYIRFTQLFKQAKNKVFFVGGLLGEKPLFINDPWGKDESSYRNTYRRITAALSHFTVLMAQAQKEKAN
jgi:protein-tyrosine-phosphatase/predicted ATP-grasp superfamily ATP-dependent carboligase